MDDEPEVHFDQETLTGIINLLMRIDARLETLLDIFFEEDDDDEETET